MIVGKTVADVVVQHGARDLSALSVAVRPEVEAGDGGGGGSRGDKEETEKNGGLHGGHLLFIFFGKR